MTDSRIEHAHEMERDGKGSYAEVHGLKQLNREFVDWSPEAITSIKVPTLLIAGDSDIVRPEHVVELFRLPGGGVPGDNADLPRSQLAVLPGTTHITLIDRANWLVSMITQFLDTSQPT